MCLLSQTEVVGIPIGLLISSDRNMFAVIDVSPLVRTSSNKISKQLFIPIIIVPVFL